MTTPKPTPESALVDVLTESRHEGFLGPGPVEAHIDHALGLARNIAHPPDRVADLGAGGGVPGLVLAASVWPRTNWGLLDANQRRTDFLRHAVTVLGLVDRVDVVTGRIEELAHEASHRGRYDLVLARSFGPPSATAECAAPLLKTGGTLVVSEPPESVMEERWPSGMLAQVGLQVEEGPAGSDDGPSVARFVQTAPCPARYPRRTGVPWKRPLR